jgi:hypothetical protein
MRKGGPKQAVMRIYVVPAVLAAAHASNADASATTVYPEYPGRVLRYFDAALADDGVLDHGVP